MNILQKCSLKSRVTLFTLAIFLISIWSLAFYASRVLHNDMQRLLGEQQRSTVSFIAAEVNYELIDRMNMLKKVADSVISAGLSDAASLQKVVQQHPALLDQFNGGLVVRRIDGTAVAGTSHATSQIGLDYVRAGFSGDMLQVNEPTIGPPIMDKTQRVPVFGMTAPLRNRQGKQIGTLVGIINLGKSNFLDRITENRYGMNGYYLLEDPQNRLIITSTDKSVTMQPLPDPGSNPLIDRHLQGHEETEIAINPAGVEILSSARRIPSANWLVVAALPTSEAFAPIHDMQQRMLLATIFLTLLAGSLTWWMLRRQLTPMLDAARTLASLTDSNTPPQALPITRRDEIGKLISGFNRLLQSMAVREESLKASEAHFRNFFEHNSSVMLLLDPSSEKIIEANAAAAAYYGYPKALLATMSTGDINTMPPAQLMEERQRALREHRSHFLFKHRLASGEVRDVDVYSTPIETSGRSLLFNIIHDITDRKRFESMLLESEARLRTIIENEPECIKIVDAQGRLAHMNPAGLAMIEADSLEQVTGHQVVDMVAPAYRQTYTEMHQRVLAGEAAQFEFEVIGLKGGRRWLETHAVPMQDHGETVHLAVTRDITGKKQAEEKLHLAASVFTHAREGILITDADGRIIDVNDTFSQITGYSRDDVLGRTPNILNSGHQSKDFYAAMWRDLIEHGHWYGEVWNRRKNGEVYAEMLTISAVRDKNGITRQYVALFSDITVIKEHEKQLEHIAHYDALTTLPNRVLLGDRLHQAMSLAQRHDKRLAVAYLDLDGFKTINDSHGHEAGDQLLMAVASRMKEALRDGDTLARLGGDEFVAVMYDLTDLEASVPVLSRLLAAAARPVRVGTQLFQVSASIGVTFYPQTEDVDADQLMRQADQAMYQAKLAGKNRYHVFDAEHDRSVRGHHESLEHIRRALTAGEFVLHYQPKVNMRTGKIIGAEALVRWNHPEQGLLPPAVFLPAIENHPLAVELGEWVIDTAMGQIESWRAAGLDVAVSVNIGACQLQQAKFVERLRALLAAHPGVGPESIELEVLETSALEDLARASQVINDCQELGIAFAMDDFGTGYS
ncbi:MAG TPA: PAS domain S-box protein, partial [Gallionellaceae bacterium]